MKYLDINYYLHLIDKLLKRPQAESGFIPYKPHGRDEIHIAGKETSYLGASKEVLMEVGDYRLFRPIGEHQKRDGDDKMDCVTRSETNVIEEQILYFNYLVENNLANSTQKSLVEIFKHFEILYFADGKWNCDIAERPIAKLSGTTRRGNSQKNVVDAIRHYGLVAEKYWPWVDSWDEYYKEVPPDVIRRGKAILEYIDITYEWADPAIARDSLRYGPLQTSVYAWNGTQDGVYYRTTNQRNHAVVKDAYIDPVYHIFDSYDVDGDFGKRLAKDFLFGYDLLTHIHLKKPLTEFNQAKINELLKSGVEYVLLVEDYEKYTRGLWQLTDNGLVKVDDNNLPEEYKKQRNDAFIRERAADGSLKPYAPFNFKELVNI